MPEPKDCQDDLSGQTISQRYNIITILAEGGMGQIYLADDTKLNRKVVFKFPLIKSSSSAELIPRLKREAELVASLNHPNIVTIHDVGEFNDRPYIIMEYVEGESLRKFLKDIKQKEAKVSIDQIFEIIIQICQGLQAAHTKKIIHRDIKPENLLIDKRKLIKVTDFGLAKLINSSNVNTSRFQVGTLGYMSPEQIKNKNPNERSDIFSLGIVLYELITCRLPFNGDSEEEIFKATINSTPEPLVRYRQDIPDGLQRIIDKTLSKKSKNRYQNVNDLLIALEREKNVFLRTKTIPRPIPTPPITKNKWREAISILWRKAIPYQKYFVITGIIATILGIIIDSWELFDRLSPTSVVSISTVPEDAEVFLNQKFIGKAPIPDTSIQSGKVSLKISKVGYVSIDTSIVVEKGINRVLMFTLKKASAPLPDSISIQIASKPTGATVFLNGRSLGATQLNFSARSNSRIKLRLQKLDYVPLDTALVIGKGQDSIFTFVLKLAARVSIKANPTTAKFRLDGKPIQPAEGNIDITSEPPGASILLDDNDIGATPKIIPKEEGNHQILFRKQGYKEYSTTVTVVRGQTQTVNAKLTALVGTLNVLVSPFGSLIYLNEKFYEENTDRPFKTELAVGTYLLKVVNPKFGIWEKMIKIAAEESLNMTIDFKKSVKLRITSMPESGGEIFVDGISKGYTPKQLILGVGKHRIELRREGYAGETKIINLEDDLKEPLQLRLTKNP